jgi:hypothetical protein
MALNLFDFDLDQLAGNRACDQHDGALVARQHAPAGNGLFRAQPDPVSGLHQSYRRDGSP